ncbi:hypothetical protein BCV70DRAFT_2561 [Testicularia cyperi]|uniref:Uncharacterized protein n=1 Tax=Testicularia cyperi TaxID=1882483 RepID=A0A317XWR5_9BASI|nr:hypothetical protein BCV70DRAFT_2561 [Testicularia cyperi]
MMLRSRKSTASDMMSARTTAPITASTRKSPSHTVARSTTSTTLTVARSMTTTRSMATTRSTTTAQSPTTTRSMTRISLTANVSSLSTATEHPHKLWKDAIYDVGSCIVFSEPSLRSPDHPSLASLLLWY